MFGTVFGVGVFLVFLLLAVHVLTHLYATSVVEAVAYDAVQSVSGAASTSVTQAEAQARTLLGGLSQNTTFQWNVTEDEIALVVTAQRSSVLPAAVGQRLGLDTIEREYRMRVEQFR